MQVKSKVGIIGEESDYISYSIEKYPRKYNESLEIIGHFMAKIKHTDTTYLMVSYHTNIK